METEAEPGYPGMSKTWFYRALIAGLIFGGIFAAVAQQWWLMPIAVVVAVALGSGWAALQRHLESAG